MPLTDSPIQYIINMNEGVYTKFRQAAALAVQGSLPETDSSLYDLIIESSHRNFLPATNTATVSHTCAVVRAVVLTTFCRPGLCVCTAT